MNTVVMMNLVVGARHSKRRLPLWLSGFGLAIAASAWLLMPSFESPLRPLELEEREVVVSVLNNLVSDMPQFSEWTEDFTSQFTQNGVPAFVQASLGEELVRTDEEVLFFSAAFFNADSMAQRNALAKAVFSLNPGLATTASDLAATTDKE